MNENDFLPRTTDNTMTRNFFLWGAWYASTNIGDRTLLISIMDLILEEVPNAVFTIASANPATIRSYLPDKHRSITTLYENKKDLLKIIRRFSGVNAFVFGGGVPFYDDLPHNLTILFFTLLSKINKVPMITWAVASQNIQAGFTKMTLKQLVTNLSVITCRDEYTKKMLIDRGAGEGQVKIVADPGYTIQNYNHGNADKILDKFGRKEGDKLVALAPRTLRRNDGESHTHFSEQQIDAQQKEIDVYARFLDIIVENGYRPVFIPMNTTAPDDDKIVTRDIVRAAKYGDVAIQITEKVEFGEVVDVFSKCEFSFLSRIHGSINSFNGNSPWIMYAFDLKHKQLMSVLGLNDWVFDPDTMMIEDIDSLAMMMIDKNGDQKIWISKIRPSLLQSAKLPIKLFLERV